MGINFCHNYGVMEMESIIILWEFLSFTVSVLLIICYYYSQCYCCYYPRNKQAKSSKKINMMIISQFSVLLLL